MNSAHRLALGVLALLVGVAATPLLADDKVKRHDRPQEVELDQNEALERLKRSEFKPLSDAIAKAQKAVSGEIVRVKVKRVKDRLAYELKIITSQGHIREVYIDPATLQVLEIE